jgi:hypothetical protein
MSKVDYFQFERELINEPKMQSNQPYDVMIDKHLTDLAYHYWEQRGHSFGSSEVD